MPRIDWSPNPAGEPDALSIPVQSSTEAYRLAMRSAMDEIDQLLPRLREMERRYRMLRMVATGCRNLIGDTSEFEEIYDWPGPLYGPKPSSAKGPSNAKKS